MALILGPHWTAHKPPKRHEVSQESCLHLPLCNRDDLHTTAEKGGVVQSISQTPVSHTLLNGNGSQGTEGISVHVTTPLQRLAKGVA